MRTLRTALALLLLSVAAPAAAEEPAADAPFPTLATLDRQTDHSSGFAALGLTFFGEEGPDFGARFDLGGQYVTPKGFGGYAALPITYASAEDDSQTELGNVELGGLYVLPAGTGTDVVLHGGIALPTAPDDFDALVHIVGLLPRQTDLTSISGAVTYLRLGASPLVRSGSLFFRADVGLDFAIQEDDGGDADTLYRINVAGGYDAGAFAVAGELVSLGSLDDSDDVVLNTIALSVSGAAGGVRPFGAVVLPLDNELYENSDAFAIVGGVEIPIASR